MKEFSQEAEQVMIERFGKDTIISLATTENATPYVRYVNAYYENGAFYVITHNCIEEIGREWTALSCSWF